MYQTDPFNESFSGVTRHAYVYKGNIVTTRRMRVLRCLIAAEYSAEYSLCMYWFWKPSAITSYFRESLDPSSPLEVDYYSRTLTRKYTPYRLNGRRIPCALAVYKRAFLWSIQIS